LPGQRHIPDLDETQGRYRVRFARTEGDLETVQRLRFRVFNLELGEGLAESYATGRDEDRFDVQCQHLMVEETGSGRAVGTYRMQVAENALAGAGFYSAGEFELGALPDEVLLASSELGRACVEREHRTKKVLYLLWRGLVEYSQHNEKGAFFGCSSITSQDPAVGLRLHRQLERAGRVHPDLRVEPLPDLRCEAADNAVNGGPPIELPTLFHIYLRHGAYVLGPPALDRQFGTIDFLTYLVMNPGHLKTFGRRPA
jgi:putative hemolysin